MTKNTIYNRFAISIEIAHEKEGGVATRAENG